MDYSRRTLLSSLLILMFVMCLLASSAQARLYSGAGSPNDPFIIDSAEDMNDIGNNEADWDKHFRLDADIDLGIYTGTQFNMIGYFIGYDDPDNKPFTGVFDGNDYTISNFTYNKIATGWKDSTGIFAYAEDAEFKNLGLIDPNVEGEVVGALVGRLGVWSEIVYTTTITNCYVQGGNVTNVSNPSTSLYAGGLVGNAADILIMSNCYATCDVSSSSSVTGGLIGTAVRGTITNCYATGNIVSYSDAGGLMGNAGADIYNCYATGNVTSNSGSSAGGLVVSSTGSIYDSFATGDVYCVYTSSSALKGTAGGLVASGGDEGQEIVNCYATGNVTAGFVAGGLAGVVSSGLVLDCYATGSVEVLCQDISSINYETPPYAGGLVGTTMGRFDEITNNRIRRCYATGNVTSTYQAGGLIGWNWGSGDISDCYATGSVTGIDPPDDPSDPDDDPELRRISGLGGLIGESGGTITNCYSVGQVSDKSVCRNTFATPAYQNPSLH